MPCRPVKIVTRRPSPRHRSRTPSSQPRRSPLPAPAPPWLPPAPRSSRSAAPAPSPASPPRPSPRLPGRQTPLAPSPPRFPYRAAFLLPNPPPPLVVCHPAPTSPSLAAQRRRHPSLSFGWNATNTSSQIDAAGGVEAANGGIEGPADPCSSSGGSQLSVQDCRRRERVWHS